MYLKYVFEIQNTILYLNTLKKHVEFKYNSLALFITDLWWRLSRDSTETSEQPSTHRDMSPNKQSAVGMKPLYSLTD